MAAAQTRLVHVAFDVDPSVDGDEDLLLVGKFVKELAQDAALLEDDPAAWREQHEGLIELKKEE